MSNELAELFPATVLLASEFSVDGRALHAWLGVGARFNMWVSRRIRSLSLVEGVDFVLLRNEQNEIKDFRVTVPIAKELGMSERNAKGREVRRYFLECERIALVEYPILMQELLQIQQKLFEAEATLSKLLDRARKPKKELVLCVPFEIPVLPGFPPHTEMRVVKPSLSCDPVRGMAEIWFHEKQIEGLHAKIEKIKERLAQVA